MRATSFSEKTSSRRQFIKKTAQLGALLAAGSYPVVAEAKRLERKTLSFYHTHTRQSLDVAYFRHGMYDQAALRQINHYLRDFRTGEVHTIDRRLLDVLWDIQQDMGYKGTFEVISGFRSPATNKKLRKNSVGVAKKSLHMQGRAIDIRFSEAPTRYVQQCAIAMQCGGVGYYPKSDFVHIDTGRFRTW